jgi:hypothetical protein
VPAILPAGGFEKGILLAIDLFCWMISHEFEIGWQT